MIRTFPRFQLYNSDSHRRTVGIWRYGGGGVIHPTYYEYDSQSIGPYTFRERYGYVVRFYYEKSTPAIWRLYKELTETRTGLAAMFVNNSHICILYPDALKYIDLRTREAEVFKFKDGEFSYRDVVDVGWIRTHVQCAQVCHLPFRLQMDLATGQIYLGEGQWVTPEGFPMVQTEINYPMYKRLLEQPETKTAVMYDMINNMEVFL